MYVGVPLVLVGVYNMDVKDGELRACMHAYTNAHMLVFVVVCV